MMIATAWIVRRQHAGGVDRWFRRLQLLSSAIFSFSHGTNDAQKVMGIIAVVLFGTIWKDRAVPRAALGGPPLPRGHRRWARSSAAGGS